VRVFDFEERAETLEPVPRHWIRHVDQPERGLDRPGFPSWNESRFDDEHAASGSWSAMLPTRGGSVRLRLASGVVPVIPGADYRIETRVRTDDLRAARARLTARLLDAHNVPIESSEASSEAIRTGGEWRTIGVELLGEQRGGAWLQIDLELLQPDQLGEAVRSEAAPGLEPPAIEDIGAAAWFDDVTVSQTPRIEISAGHPSNVIIAPERPRLEMTIRDLTGEPLRAHVVVRDAAGRVIDQAELPVGSAGRARPWTPDLEGFGWRHATLVVRSGAREVGRAEVGFVWAPAHDRVVSDERRRFVILAEETGEEHLRLLPEMVERLGAGAAQLSAWTRDMGTEDAAGRAETLAPSVERLLDAGVTVGFALAPTPTALVRASRKAGDGPLAFVQRPFEEILPFLTPIVDRFGQRVRRWQIGETGRGLLGASDAFASDLKALAERFERLTPEPLVGARWSAGETIDPDVASVAALTLTAPASHHPAAMAQYADLLPEDEDVTLTLQTLDPERYGRHAPAIDLAFRMIHAWRAQPARIGVEAPWVERGGRTPGVSPTPHFAIIRNMIDRLAERRVVAELPIGRHGVGYVLEGPGEDALVAWRTEPGREEATLSAYLAGGDLRVVDLWGNVAPLPIEAGEHRVTLGEEPVFIEGIDAELAQFRAGFRVEPSFITSAASRRRLELVLENPWTIPITGRIRIAEPERWEAAPRVQTFSVAPDEPARLPFEASFGVGEEAGPQTVEVEISLDAVERYPTMRLESAVEIGLPNVQISPGYRIDPGERSGPGDLTVTLLVTNVGDRPVTLRAFAGAPGFPRREAPVSALQPKQSVLKRFRFPGGGDLRGQQVRVGVVETEGYGRLNKTLRIE